VSINFLVYLSGDSPQTTAISCDGTTYSRVYLSGDSPQTTAHLQEPVATMGVYLSGDSPQTTASKLYFCMGSVPLALFVMLDEELKRGESVKGMMGEDGIVYQ